MKNIERGVKSFNSTAKFNSRFLDATMEAFDMPKRKPVVNYRESSNGRIVLGHPAIICPINHPATSRVSNTKEAITSVVLSIHRDAKFEVSEFETMNTIYRRV